LQQTSHSQTRVPSSEELSLIARAFAAKLSTDDVHALLKYLNGLTDYRFTGVYRFEKDWVVSVALWDRENPQLSIGADVKMKESYCWLTGLGDTSYIIEDAPNDPRLAGHAARDDVRAYASVLLRDRTGKPWGTLCHFDFQPRLLGVQTLAELESFRPLVEEFLVRDAASRWICDVPY
jgi:GAF domain-containing protein